VGTLRSIGYPCLNLSTRLILLELFQPFQQVQDLIVSPLALGRTEVQPPHKVGCTEPTEERDYNNNHGELLTPDDVVDKPEHDDYAPSG
jgi:hypothetical protein